MGKVMLLFMLTLGLYADISNLEKNCLSCHKAQQIPSELIYRRYLMEYSTKARMEDAMLKYLKNPEQSASIMPQQFFLKFPMKEKNLLDKVTLKAEIKAYLEEFDIREKLILEK